MVKLFLHMITQIVFFLHLSSESWTQSCFPDCCLLVYLSLLKNFALTLKVWENRFDKMLMHHVMVEIWIRQHMAPQHP